MGPVGSIKSMNTSVTPYIDVNASTATKASHGDQEQLVSMINANTGSSTTLEPR
jgi:hypothetical protein